MKKEEFLEKLDKKLSVLDEKERKKIYYKYDSLINEAVKNGKTEEEAVNDVGDLNILAKDILKNYKIDKDYLDKKEDHSFEGIINRFINYFVDGTKSFINKVETKDYRSIFEILIYIFLAIFVFWIIRLPFYIIEVMGNGIFSTFANPLENVLHLCWSLTVNVCYIFLVIWIVLIILKRLNPKTEDKKEKKEQKTNIKEEKVTVTETKIKTTNVPLDIISLLIKIFIVIAMIPFILMEIGLVIAIGVIVALMIKGVALLGFLLMTIGILILIGSITSLIFYLTFNKGGQD